MELRIHKGTLEEAVSETASVLGKKSVLPLLNGIKVEVKEKELVFVGCDGELMIKKVIPVHKGGFESIETGACVLPADFFQDLVKKMPGPVHMKKVNGRIVMESGEVKASLSALSTEEYLSLPDVEEDGSISMNSMDLVELVRQTLFAAAKEESRPVLTGIHLEFSGNHVQAIATDAHRLAFVKKTLNGGKDHSFTAPMKALRELMKLFKNTKECLKIHITDQLFKIESNEVSLISKLIDGAFPDMAALLSKSSKTEVVIDKKRLMYSVDRAGLFAKDAKNHQIKLRLTEEKTLNISSFSPQVGMIEENIPLIRASEEDTMNVWIDSVFLLEALRATKGDDIQLFYNGNMSPLILRSRGIDEQVHVISPVRA